METEYKEKIQNNYREMIQKGFITLEEANRTLISLGFAPLNR